MNLFGLNRNVSKYVEHVDIVKTKTMVMMSSVRDMKYNCVINLAVYFKPDNG